MTTASATSGFVVGGMGVQAAQRPKSPSGFNYTQHNCNTPGSTPARRDGKHSRSSGRKGWHCGDYTVVGPAGDEFKYLRYRCKAYRCDVCGPRKLRRVRKSIVRHAVDQQLQRFLTLTLDPKRLPKDLDCKGQIDYLKACWRKMRVYLQRKLGRTLAFILVVELQANGTPHLHALVGSYLNKSWISHAWQALGGGWATRIEHVDVHRVAAYLSKYVTADSLWTIPPNVRRFSTSRGLRLFERPKATGAWILCRRHIEHFRGDAAYRGVLKATHYEADADGIPRLITFNASTLLPGVLAFPGDNEGASDLAGIAEQENENV